SNAHTAAWVRFATWIFRKIDFMCTLTVASVMSHVRAMTLLACPCTRPLRIWASRSDSLGPFGSDEPQWASPSWPFDCAVLLPFPTGRVAALLTTPVDPMSCSVLPGGA